MNQHNKKIFLKKYLNKYLNKNTLKPNLPFKQQNIIDTTQMTNSKIIFSIFAGRKRYLQVLNKYTDFYLITI
jgi:hypothetical protein